jgi:flagellar protein FliS
MYAQRYVENDLMVETPVELVRLLYSKAIEKCTQAAAHTRGGDIRERGACLARVMEIVTELQASLNFEAGDLALELARLYDYIQRRLIDAAGDASSATQIEEVGVLLGNLFEGWRDCEPPSPAGPSEVESIARTPAFHTLPDLAASLVPSADPSRESRVWTL